MSQAEITVQFLGTNKKNPKYGYIKSSEGDTYGCLAEHLKQFSTGQIYRIQFHTNDKGYKEFDAIVSKPPVKQNTRPSTSHSDALHIYVNGKLAAFIAAGKLELAMTEIVEATDLLVDAYYNSKLSGNKVQTRDDLQDEIPY